MKQQGVKKTVPPTDHLQDAFRRAYLIERINQAVAREWDTLSLEASRIQLPKRS